MAYYIDNPNKWRISKSGFSIKTGWATDSRIIVKYPGEVNPINSELFSRWLEDAEEICKIYNSIIDAQGII